MLLTTKVIYSGFMFIAGLGIVGTAPIIGEAITPTGNPAIDIFGSLGSAAIGGVIAIKALTMLHNQSVEHRTEWKESLEILKEEKKRQHQWDRDDRNELIRALNQSSTAHTQGTEAIHGLCNSIKELQHTINKDRSE